MHTVSENQCGIYALLLQQARTEAQADAATRFSSHLDAMIRHITKAELSPRGDSRAAQSGVGKISQYRIVSRGGALMSCSRSVVLLNNALKIAVMKNGDLSLIQLGIDKEKREITESVIAIYQNELNLLSDVVNLLVKRAVFHKQISSVDELTKLTTEIASYCADEFKKLNDKRSW